jgi:hypothetical protein
MRAICVAKIYILQDCHFFLLTERFWIELQFWQLSMNSQNGRYALPTDASGSTILEIHYSRGVPLALM